MFSQFITTATPYPRPIHDQYLNNWRRVFIGKNVNRGRFRTFLDSAWAHVIGNSPLLRSLWVNIVK